MDLKQLYQKSFGFTLIIGHAGLTFLFFAVGKIAQSPGWKLWVQDEKERDLKGHTQLIGLIASTLTACHQVINLILGFHPRLCAVEPSTRIGEFPPDNPLLQLSNNPSLHWLI